MANPKKKKGKSKEIIIFSVIGLALIGSFIVALSGKGGPGGIGQGTNPTPQPTASSSISAPPGNTSPTPTPKTTTFPPIPQSKTALDTAKEAQNVPTTPDEKTYYACLENPSTLSSASCKTAENVVSKEVNVYGSNMALKFKYQVIMNKVFTVQANFIAGMNARKLVVDGVDYYGKKGLYEMPANGSFLNPTGGSAVSLDGLKVYIYDSPQTFKGLCVSGTSFDGKITFKSTYDNPNVFIGTPCSPTSLK